MKAKDKARELVDKMTAYTFDDVKSNAIVAVDFAKSNPLNSEGYNKFLDEVKQEILKL